VPILQLLVTTDTNHSHAIEVAKGLRLVPFTQKDLFAVFAPRLQITGIIIILNEANRRNFGIHHMTTNNCGKALTVQTTVNQ